MVSFPNIRVIIKKMIYSNGVAYGTFMQFRRIKKSLCQKKSYELDNQGCARLKKDIEGNNHKIIIGNGCVLQNTMLHIRGNNNRILFEENCLVGENCSFWMEGNNISIIIGAGTTFTHTIHFCAQEDNTSIRVGTDCMFSNNIIVRTSDSHPIYKLQTQERINPAKDVVIGNHVWVAPNTKIMKGAQIGDGAIIGSDTMVSHHVPENALAVGHPAKIVKSDVEWTRERLF